MAYYYHVWFRKEADMSKNIRGRNLKIFINFIVTLWLAVGCVQVPVQVPLRIPSVFVEHKIPYRVVLVIPEDIRQHECTCFRVGASLPHAIYSIQCGLALYEACTKTMYRIFVDVQTVKDIKEARKPWDLALWMEVDKFEMSCPIFMNTSVCISLRYKLTDKNNKELFSSSISFEEDEEEIEYGFRNVMPFLLASNDSNYLLDIAEPVKVQTAWAEEPLLSRIISQVINKVMIKMVEEIMDAYNKGQI
jgi:hypothetical protein